jgi:hypothetical protein
VKRGWTKDRDVKVGNPSGFPLGSDGWIWWNYSLFLLINRHCADFQDDDTVSDALHTVRERIPLPYLDYYERDSNEQ